LFYYKKESYLVSIKQVIKVTEMNSSVPNEILIEEKAVEKKVSFYFASLIIGTIVIFLGLWIVSALLYYLGKFSLSIGGPSLELPPIIWSILAFVMLLTLLMLISGIINHVKRRVRFDFANQKVEELDTENRVVLSIPFEDLSFIKIEEHKIESFSQRFSKGSRAGFFVTLHLFDKDKRNIQVSSFSANIINLADYLREFKIVDKSKKEIVYFFRGGEESSPRTRARSLTLFNKSAKSGKKKR
jgi:hypothetical protein